MFDASVGRFTTTDPLGFAAGDPNLYRYVGNGPTNATDPSGLAEDELYPKFKDGDKGEFGPQKIAKSNGWTFRVFDVGVQFLNDKTVGFSYGLHVERPEAPVAKGKIFRAVILNEHESYGLLADGTDGPLLFSDEAGKKPIIEPANPFDPNSRDFQQFGQVDYVVDLIRDKSFFDLNARNRRPPGAQKELVPELVGKGKPIPTIASLDLPNRHLLPCRFPSAGTNPPSALFVRPGVNGSEETKAVTGKDNGSWAFFVVHTTKHFGFVPEKDPARLKLQAAEFISKATFIEMHREIQRDPADKKRAILDTYYIFINRPLVAKIGMERFTNYVQSQNLTASIAADILKLAKKPEKEQFGVLDQDHVEKLYFNERD